MEADSQISGNKTIENKSVLSFNYIYKKVIIKEDLRNSISEIRALNYEKIAKYKMKNMNLKFLLNSIFKLKNSINSNNPLFKYIKNVQSYQYKNLKINISQKVPFLELIFKNNINNKFPRTEKIINLSQSVKNFRNFYYSRMSNIEYKKINNNKIEKIILIQKHVRGFLSKKILDEEINKIIVKIIIGKILKLQKAIREFLHKKKSLSHFIINIIQNERFSKSNKITDIFSLYHFRNLYKKKLLINKILKARYESILKIQNKFRAFIILKKVKDIINKEKNSHVLTYPFNAESVQIKIFMNTSYKVYEYFICPVRKYFVLYIDKSSINSGEYLCHMIVNNNIVLDKRYKYIVDKNNILYNLIYIGDPPLKLPKKEKKSEKKIKKKSKKKKKKKKNNDTDNDNDFFYYCYNENSNSTNSYSTKSDQKLKISQFNIENLNTKKGNILENNSRNINELFRNKKKNLKKNISLESTNKFSEFLNINTGNMKEKNKFCKSNNFSSYFNKKLSPNNELKDNVYLYDQNSIKEDSIQSQKIIYSNILNELNPSVSSFSRSNFSMNNINAYSKKTHQTKFCSNNNIKNISKKKGLDKNTQNLGDLYIHTINISKFKNI